MCQQASLLHADWLHKSEQPIISQDSKLTQLLTMTTTYKFPPQDNYLFLEPKQFEDDEDIYRQELPPFHLKPWLYEDSSYEFACMKEGESKEIISLQNF